MKKSNFSLTFWFNRKTNIELTKKTIKLKNKIYFLYGDNEGDADMATDLNKIDDLVSEKRCECLKLTKMKIVKGGQHNKKIWRDGFANAYL